MRYSEFECLLDDQFKRHLGVSKQLFEELISVFKEELNKKKKKIGGPPRVSEEDQVIITLKYWRHYLTQEELALQYDISQQTVGRYIKKVEEILIKSGKFSLPKIQEEMILIADVFETPIERPQKDQHQYYSGKKTPFNQNRNTDLCQNKIDLSDHHWEGERA